jgi:hypothetical protein
MINTSASRGVIHTSSVSDAPCPAIDNIQNPHSLFSFAAHIIDAMVHKLSGQSSDNASLYRIRYSMACKPCQQSEHHHLSIK